jgi:hypothetical protein
MHRICHTCNDFTGIEKSKHTIKDVREIKHKSRRSFATAIAVDNNSQKLIFHVGHRESLK